MSAPRTGVLAALIVVLLPAAALTQVNTGRIVGTVRDPSNAAVPQATVVVSDTATNIAVTVVTNERGDFVVTPLNPGTYSVTVTLDGFQTAVVKAVEVQVGQSARADVDLKLGALTESMVVASGTPLLDTESGTLGHVVTNTQIVNLPLNGRSFYELARLTPGRCCCRAAATSCASERISSPAPRSAASAAARPRSCSMAWTSPITTRAGR
jgi:hypothetical protein